MTELSPFQHVTNILQDLGLDPKVCDKSPDVPVEIALVSLGLDERERPLVLQVVHAQQNVNQISEEFVQVPPMENEEPSPGETEFHLVSFIVALPVEIPVETTPEVLRVLSLANKSIPLGHFNFSEIESSVYYSYSLPTFSDLPSEMTILMIINTILFAKDTFFSTIEEVAMARETVETLVQYGSRHKTSSRI